jgi:carboxyl-terminal processing protease
MIKARFGNSMLAVAALLAGCGGGGSSGGGSTSVTPPPPPPPTASCSLQSRQDWAAGVLREWYLFPETLPASLSTNGFATVNDYVDALTATARSQRRDRFFSFVSSIAEDTAFFSSGASAGLGVRLATDAATRRVLIAEAFEGAPALAAGIDRGTEILAIGTTSANLRSVSDIIAAEGSAGVSNALGPTTAGTTRLLRITDAAGTREVSVTKATFDLIPVSARYGAQIVNDGAKRVAYLNLRTFVSTADPQLRTAFNNFRTQGITEFVIDFRYNGGGLVSTAELLTNLLGRNRTASDILSVTTFRPEKAAENSTERFSQQSQSVAPVKIAFITTGSTASASELVINSMLPYLGTGVAIVGANSFGKPVGQIAIDRAACDDRFRVIAFSTQNANGGGFYYDGLKATVPNSCQAADDVTRPLGDPQEASLARALDFLAGRTCTPIAVDAQGSLSDRSGRAQLLTPRSPTSAQREVPGLF